VFGLVIAGVPGVVAGLGVVAVRWWAGPHSRLRRLTGPGPTAWLVLVAAVLAATYRAASGTGLAVPVTWWDEIPSVLVLVAFLRLAADVTGADVVRRHRTRAGTHHRRADPACTDHAPRSDVRAGDAITPDRSRQ
jgi:hypothetical protein